MSVSALYAMLSVGRSIPRCKITRASTSKGEDNVWAYHLDRWSTVSIVRRLVPVTVLPSSSDPESIWPDSSEITLVLQNHAIDRREHLERKIELYRNLFDSF